MAKGKGKGVYSRPLITLFEYIYNLGPVEMQDHFRFPSQINQRSRVDRCSHKRVKPWTEHLITFPVKCLMSRADPVSFFVWSYQTHHYGINLSIPYGTII